MVRSIGRIGAAAAVFVAAATSAWAGDDSAPLAYDYAAADDAGAAFGYDDASATFDYAAQYVPQPAWTEHGGWRFAIVPYAYLPMIEGKLRYRTPRGAGDQPTVKLNARDVLEALNFAFMVSGEARKGRWGVLTDVMYADLSADRSKVRTLTGPRGLVQVPIDVGTKVDVNLWLWTLAAGAELGHSDGPANIEAFAGFRFLAVDTDLKWSLAGPLDQFPRSGRVSQDEEIWDAIGGVRGRIALDASRRWNATYYVDVGAGDSDLTWQVVAGLAYDYNWGDLRFAWRYISYDEPAGKLVDNMNLSGPAFGATFRF